MQEVENVELASENQNLMERIQFLESEAEASRKAGENDGDQAADVAFVAEQVLEKAVNTRRLSEIYQVGHM